MDRFLAGRMPDEIVHSALEKVLIGDTHPKKGRKLSVKNRQSTAAFALCVMGIINSQLSNAINAAEASFLHLPLGDAETERGTVDVPGAIDPGQLLEQRDTKRELFARLREQAGPELHPIVDDWSRTIPVISLRGAGSTGGRFIGFACWRARSSRIWHESFRCKPQPEWKC